VGAALVLAWQGAARAEEPIEVEVQGDRIAAPPKEPSVAGSVIREERLRAPGLQASDVLRTQPGVAVVETGGYGALSTASMRGATAAQTPVYLAGIRLNDDVGGTADLSMVPLWMVQRVEIYRSHAPLAGDRLGIGGAIFFEPRRPRAPEAGAGAMAGSFGAHALWARGGIGDDSAGAFVGVRFEGARNDYTFLSEGGTLFERTHDRRAPMTNADTTTVDAWATGRARLGDRGQIHLVANDLEREQGLQGHKLYNDTGARVAFSRRLAGVTARLATADDSREVTTTTAAIVTHAGYDDPYSRAGLGTTRLDLDATRVEDSILARWSLSDRLSFSPAFRMAIERLGVQAATHDAAHAQRVFGRAALQAEWTTFEGVTLRALGNAECHGTSLNGKLPWSLPGDSAGPIEGNAVCNQFEPAARVGVQVDQGPVTFLANVGRYARVPTLIELYGLSGAVRGNTGLIPETGISAEVGVRASGSAGGPLRGASVDLFGFVRNVDHLVSYQRSAINYVRPFNLGSARIAGIEMMATYRPAPFVVFELAATVLDPRNTSRDRPVNNLLPYLPRLVLAPRVELGTRLDAGPLRSGKLSISYFHEASHYADQAGLDVIPEQGSLDADLAIGLFHEHLSLRGRVSNVLNQTRWDLIGYPLPGRAAYAALEAQW
jgi:iron complex outermembrane receptor protein